MPDDGDIPVPVLPYVSGRRPRLDWVQRLYLVLIACALLPIGGLMLGLALHGPMTDRDGTDGRFGAALIGAVSVIGGSWALYAGYRQWQRRRDTVV